VEKHSLRHADIAGVLVDQGLWKKTLKTLKKEPHRHACHVETQRRVDSCFCDALPLLHTGVGGFCSLLFATACTL